MGLVPSWDEARGACTYVPPLLALKHLPESDTLWNNMAHVHD